jgi:hypothetical protein
MFTHLAIAQQASEFFDCPLQSFQMKVEGTQPGATHHSFKCFSSLHHDRGSIQQGGLIENTEIFIELSNRIVDCGPLLRIVGFTPSVDQYIPRFSEPATRLVCETHFQSS